MADSEANPAVSDETLPDLLKNTPSNIARLEDVIEHSKGRQKYLAHTRSPSDGGDVRWYFCKVPLAVGELAASVPRTEIVGKGDYFRFGMRDSLAIEASFLQREEEFLSSWWKEFAECSEGPKGRPSSSKNLDTQRNAQTPDGARVAETYDAEEERVGVPVKGGLYEVDLVKRHCFPVYWNGENRRVLRGHWFARKGGVDWLPLREDVAEQLEIAYHSQVWHRRTFQPSGLFAARVDLQGSTMGLHALFTGEDDTWEAWLNSDSSGPFGIVSFGRNGIKLRRGYSVSHSVKPTQDELRQRKEEEMDDYCSQVPVRHLVFMVHGIGQRLEKSNLVDDVAQFRHITASLAERHLTSHQLGSQRVLFIPCQWRKGLKLSGEAAVEKITLHGVRGLRVMLSATVHDVLYYMSPIYCQDIINSVSNQLNKLYLKFLKRNPGYDGKVSLYGHSLGSVLSYDILCHQENLSSPFPMDWMYHERERNDEASLDANDRSLAFESSINPGQLNPNDADEANDKVENQEFMHTQSTPASEDEYAENFSTSLGSHVSNLDESNGSAVLFKQDNDKAVDHESVYDSRTVLSREGDHLCDPSGMEIDDTIDSMQNKEPEGWINTSNKDEEINLLREEVNSLKAKIAELESKYSSRDAHSDLQQENREEIEPRPKQYGSKEQPARVHEAPKSYTPYIKYTKLEFKVDTFFAVGSPLGVFLSLRNIRIGIGKGKEYWEEENITEEMPACCQMFNIFHPYDPVAYRVEPLVCKEYISNRPVIIPYHKGGRRLHIGFQEFTEDLAARSQALMHRIHSVRVKVLTVCQSRNVDSLEEGDEDTQGKEERTYGSIMMERLTRGDGRIDHMLQDKTFEHPYLQAIGSHTNYWRDHDTALFILKHLYRDVPEDSSSPTESGQGISKDRLDIRSTGWSDRREIAEEELPLTFSDDMMVKNFSRKAKKFVKKT